MRPPPHPPAPARRADTRAQVEARYGKPLSQQDDKETPGMCVCRYEHDGLSVAVTYIQGVCYGEDYVRAGGGPLSPDEVHVLLEANRCGLVWLTTMQALKAKDSGLITQADGTMIGSVPDTVFEPNSDGWFLCNPRLRYEWCAASGWEHDDKEKSTGVFWVRSFSIKKYVEDARAARAKAVLKGF